MAIQNEIRVSYNASSRLQGAVGKLLEKAYAIRSDRENKFLELLAVRQRDFPEETELQNFNAVETEMQSYDADAALRLKAVSDAIDVSASQIISTVADLQ